MATPQPSPTSGTSPKTNSSAVVSIVCGILSFAVCSLVGIVGIIYGLRAKREIQESGGTEGGEGLATAGIVLSAIGLVVMTLVIGSILLVTFLGSATT